MHLRIHFNTDSMVFINRLLKINQELSFIKFKKEKLITFCMVLTQIAPSWFFGYDVILELLFAIISLVISIFAFKIYKKTSQNSIKIFGISFILISISYFIQSFLNFLIISKLTEKICIAVKIQSITSFNNFGILAHILAMTIGLSLLTYITLKQENLKLLWLLIIIPLSAILLNTNIIYMFYLIASILLIFIEIYFISNFLKNKQIKTLLVAIAFFFLLIGNLHFLISVNHQIFYAIGHILELFAYIFILTNFYLVLKNGKKKRAS